MYHQSLAWKIYSLIFVDELFNFHDGPVTLTYRGMLMSAFGGNNLLSLILDQKTLGGEMDL